MLMNENEMSCNYCSVVFDPSYWSWCIFRNYDDESVTTLCSICAWEILNEQRENFMDKDLSGKEV